MRWETRRMRNWLGRVGGNRNRLRALMNPRHLEGIVGWKSKSKSDGPLGCTSIVVRRKALEINRGRTIRPPNGRVDLGGQTICLGSHYRFTTQTARTRDQSRASLDAGRLGEPFTFRLVALVIYVNVTDKTRRFGGSWSRLARCSIAIG